MMNEAQINRTKSMRNEDMIPTAISAVRQDVGFAHCIGCERPESPI